MISFIIIGKNIEKTIKLCIESVIQFISNNKINEYEIIYVDSDSQDKTIEIAQQLPVRIFQLSGDVNSAIGRNVGANKAKGDILCFIDGDMEIMPDFYTYAFDPKTNELIHPFINGYLVHKFYDENYNYLYANAENIPGKSFLRSVTGGLMIVERSLWENIGGMDTRLIRNQDLDFGLRMAKSGNQVLLVNRLFAVHHTVSYFNRNRLKYFFNGKAALCPGLLMRKHMLSTYYLKRHYKDVMYVALLVASLLSLFFKPILGAGMLLIYISIQLIRSFEGRSIKTFNLNSFLFKVLYGLYSMVGMLFYFPGKPAFTIKQISNIMRDTEL